MTPADITFWFCVAVGLGIAIREGVRRLVLARDNKQQREFSNAFQAARNKGDTRGQFEASNAARQLMTERLKKECGK